MFADVFHHPRKMRFEPAVLFFEQFVRRPVTDGYQQQGQAEENQQSLVQASRVSFQILDERVLVVHHWYPKKHEKVEALRILPLNNDLSVMWGM
ncbi:hypothetical protein [Pseudomonas chlororaphis]